MSDTTAKEDDTNPHVYGAGTRLSEAYTIGRDGLPCPRHYAEKGSLTRQAWQRGRNEWEQNAQSEGKE